MHRRIYIIRVEVEEDSSTGYQTTLRLRKLIDAFFWNNLKSTSIDVKEVR